MEHAQPVKQSSGGWKQRLVFSAVVSAALAFTLCLFGPLDLFFNNYEELWFHFQDIIGGVAVIALILFLCCTLLGTLLRGKLHSIYMALMFGGLLGLYVQGSFMNKDYGSLDGTAVDWNAYTGYGVVNTLIWAVCILLPLALMLVLREKKMRPVLLFLSCALIVMQGASLVVSYLNYPKVAESATLTTDGMFELSKEENTVVLVLDTLDGAFMHQVLADNPDFADRLTGFTDYTNTLASGARTPVAMPLIMTGIPRTMAGTYSDYQDYVWSKQTVFDDLKAAGYDTRLLTESQFISANAADCVDNLELTASSVGNSWGLTKKMYKLTLYKYVPHFLKWRFWMYTGDFDKYKSDTEYIVDDAKFWDRFQDSDGFTYTDSGKNFRLYHLMGAHRPYNLTANANRKKEGTTSRRRQLDGVFKIVFAMLDDMKANGVYDNSNIFIIADHGAKRNLGNGVYGMCQFAACLYKPAGSTGAFTTNDAPVSLLDVTATLDAIAGGDYSQVGSGRTVYEIQEGETRTRTFYLPIGSNSTYITGQYETTAHARDPQALKLVKQYEIQVADKNSYTLGDVLSFSSFPGANEKVGNVYCTHGFRATATKTTRMEGRYAQMVIPIANPPETGSLTVRLEHSSMVKESHLVISAGGKQVFRQNMVKSHGQETLTFDVPVSALEDGTLTLDFTFTDVSESEEDKEAGTRTQTMPVTKLVITAAE